MKGAIEEKSASKTSPIMSSSVLPGVSWGGGGVVCGHMGKNCGNYHVMEKSLANMASMTRGGFLSTRATAEQRNRARK